MTTEITAEEFVTYSLEVEQEADLQRAERLRAVNQRICRALPLSQPSFMDKYNRATIPGICVNIAGGQSVDGERNTAVWLEGRKQVFVTLFAVDVPRYGETWLRLKGSDAPKPTPLFDCFLNDDPRAFGLHLPSDFPYQKPNEDPYFSRTPAQRLELMRTAHLMLESIANENGFIAEAEQK